MTMYNSQTISILKDCEIWKVVSTGIFWAMNYFWLKLKYGRPVPVLPLACMNSEMPVQLIRSCELPGAPRPGAQVGLVPYVPPQVRPQVGSFLEIIFTNDARKCYLYRILLCKLSHSLDNDRDAWWGHLNKKYGLSSIFCYSALLSSGHNPNANSHCHKPNSTTAQPQL